MKDENYELIIDCFQISGIALKVLKNIEVMMGLKTRPSRNTKDCVGLK